MLSSFLSWGFSGPASVESDGSFWIFFCNAFSRFKLRALITLHEVSCSTLFKSSQFVILLVVPSAFMIIGPSSSRETVSPRVICRFISPFMLVEAGNIRMSFATEIFCTSLLSKFSPFIQRIMVDRPLWNVSNDPMRLSNKIFAKKCMISVLEYFSPLQLNEFFVIRWSCKGPLLDHLKIITLTLWSSIADVIHSAFHWWARLLSLASTSWQFVRCSSKWLERISGKQLTAQRCLPSLPSVMTSWLRNRTIRHSITGWKTEGYDLRAIWSIYDWVSPRFTSHMKNLLYTHFWMALSFTKVANVVEIVMNETWSFFDVVEVDITDGRYLLRRQLQ